MFKVELEEYGKVRVFFQHGNPNKLKCANPGTICIIATDEKNGETIHIEKATLYYKDTFVKEKGRKYSLTKALNKLGLSRTERTKVWNAYWNMGKTND